MNSNYSADVLGVCIDLRNQCGDGFLPRNTNIPPPRGAISPFINKVIGRNGGMLLPSSLQSFSTNNMLGTAQSPRTRPFRASPPHRLPHLSSSQSPLRRDETNLRQLHSSAVAMCLQECYHTGDAHTPGSVGTREVGIKYDCG